MLLTSTFSIKLVRGLVQRCWVRYSIKGVPFVCCSFAYLMRYVAISIKHLGDKREKEKKWGKRSEQKRKKKKVHLEFGNQWIYCNGKM